jgi:hypothetical protein
MHPNDTRYYRNLPHIHPEGYSVFITFRLADSLPLNVLQELTAQRERELNILKGQSPDEIYEIGKNISVATTRGSIVASLVHAGWRIKPLRMSLRIKFTL